MFKIIYDNAFIPDVRKCHYIARTPYNALSPDGYSEKSPVFKAALYYTGASKPELIRIFESIDLQTQTGTFYPTAAITLLPGRGIKDGDELYALYAAALDYHNHYFGLVQAVFDLRNTLFLRDNAICCPETELGFIHRLYGLECRYAKEDINTDWYVIMNRRMPDLPYGAAKPEEYIHLL